MNCKTIVLTARLASLARNPLPVVLDRLGIRKAPYRLRLRNGLVLELRPGRGDQDTFREIWLARDYMSQGQRLRPGETVMDVGANIGCFTLYAAHRVGPGGRVIAIEPETETFLQLQRNIALSGLENVVARQGAVAARRGTATLYKDENSRYSTLYQGVDQRAPGRPAERIPTDTLERIMDDEGIRRCHYLKLDCEGAEHDIIAAMSPETAARIDQITMEVHQVEGADVGRLTRRLEQLGFQARLGGDIHYYRRPAGPRP